MNATVTQTDRGIIPTEVAARKQREGELFGKIFVKANGLTPESLNMTGGRTIDQEGLSNNYAVEPEMYINQPGDLRQENATLAAKRIYELKALAEDVVGQLTMEDDTRDKGPGM